MFSQQTLSLDLRMQSTQEKKEMAVFTYDKNALQSKLGECIKKHVSPDAWNWLTEKTSAISRNENIQNLMVAFSATSRKTGKAIVNLSKEDVKEIQSIRTQFTIQGWSIDRISRVWLLMHVDPSDADTYVQSIERLFPTAEMSELVALYSALPVLAYPELWRARCAEGIRNNIADVLQSIMCNNPYPSENLDEAAWNQLVLKAIFTEKPINEIVNLDKRTNQTLADILSDYAHERWAAHRNINPLLWRCMGDFINKKNFPDVQRIASSERTEEREAAALLCSQSSYQPAKELLENNSMLRAVLESGTTWERIAEKMNRS